ncbi:MAG: hypothetical protein H0U07_13745 [Actinobacteria bacterium]|jgi:hypothetical protein|nr:hypothetical protein [Actinomycetota bacterium]MDQ3162280.1 hypothetical protein [Actinomycetota bacterium]
MPDAEVESARREWRDGHARLLEDATGRAAQERLLAQVEAVTEELRRRVGATFTTVELTRAYADADRWSREAVAERAASPDWPRTLSLVEAAAFHLYSRGAVDYEP